MNTVAERNTVAFEPEPRPDFEIHRAVLVEADRVREAQIVQCMYAARDPDNCGVIWENRRGDSWLDTVPVSTLAAVDTHTGRISRDPAVVRELIDIIMAEPEQRTFRR